MKSDRAFRTGVIALIAVGCTSSQLDRPYTTVVTCQPSGAPPLAATLAEAVARVDRDQDGQLTENDLRIGEALFVLQIEGAHESTGDRAAPGYSVHTSLNPMVVVNPFQTEPTWQVSQGRVNCLPELSVAFAFLAPEQIQQDEPVQRDLQFAAFDVQGYEIWAETGQAEGAMAVAVDAKGFVSGHLENGRAGAALYAHIPEDRPTGQTIWVEAAAFREVLLR